MRSGREAMAEAVMEPIHEKFLAVVSKHLRFCNGSQAFPMETDLGALGLDSMSAIRLLLDLEQTFGILFPDALLTAETFRTASTLENAVQSLRNM
jgi:acyl carrier protein